MGSGFELGAGTTLGPYQIQHLLGKGRNGNSYLAWHVDSRQHVTLKLLPQDQANQHLWEAVRRELRTFSSFRQPAILPVFQSFVYRFPVNPSDASQPLSISYLLSVCLYTPWSLSDVLAGRMIPDAVETWLFNLFQQVGQALNFVHQQGLVHGALVPGNLLFSQTQSWIADFSLARLSPPPAPYLAPELEALVKQCYAQQNMETYWSLKYPLADQYALAVLYSQLVSVLLSQADARSLLPVLYQAMQADPEQRFPSVEHFTYTLLRRFPLSQGGQFDRRSTPISLAPPTSGSASAEEYLQHIMAFDQEQKKLTQQSFPFPAAPKTAAEWATQGDLFFAQHRYEEAKEAYQKAISADARNATYLGAFGDSCFALEQYDAALQAYEKGIRLSPLDATLWNNRGAVLDAVGRYSDAQASYLRASQLEA
ncbi:protein kinase family protein [Dictyobacter kobayashii]|uniref:Protein kinase domain-containing protein n=1 Tax=Dictyobacter kobayashii TaxID=2014872 RepID=A0A402AVB6_9CHLR|nr:protein kinase family protein [Dictyobacter kobayashii]GCE23034.1 hypothetical protein KDK_68340 [Dictyobacter kobayashii]